MSREVFAVNADWDLHQLSEFFVDHHISGAPVVSETGELLGVVSVTDIVRHDGLNLHDMASGEAHDYYLRGLENRYAREEIASLRIETENPATVRDIMTPMIFDVAEETTVQEAADMMVKGRIHRIFVTRNKQIVGVITALDMLQVIRNL
jgi:CBS domain-containing protein